MTCPTDIQYKVLKTQELENVMVKGADTWLRCGWFLVNISFRGAMDNEYTGTKASRIRD